MKSKLLNTFIILCISTVALLFAHANMAKLTVGFLQVTGISTFTGAQTFTGLTTHGGNVVSDTDGTDDIGTSSVRWNAGYFDEVFWNKGADVASAADGMTLGSDGNYYDITGTTAIDSIAAQTVGKYVLLQFDGVLTMTDGGNLKLEGNFVSAAGATLTLQSDGVDWYEASRAGANYNVAGAFDVVGATTLAATTISTTLGVTGVSTLTGGVAYATNAPFNWSAGGAVALATAGTNSTPTDGPRMWVEIFIPSNVTLTGIGYLVGTVGGTDSVVVELFDSAGAVVARSIATDTEAADLVATLAEFQKVNFSSTVNVTAGTHYISVQFNGGTARVRTFGIPNSGFVANTAAGTFKTAASITPTTTFVAGEGPISWVF